MFDSIKQIPVDRKNSLPVSDFLTRYHGTGTPVVFGDLTKGWSATRNWSLDYLTDNVGDAKAPLYSSRREINGGQPFTPVLMVTLKEYFFRLGHEDNDLRISNLPIKAVPKLKQDFSYPRLGFDFHSSLTSLYVGGDGAVDTMVQSSKVRHTIRCHFGQRISVLLIPPIQSPFMYRVGMSQHSIQDIDFQSPQYDKYPALENLFAYVAELEHGDSLYVPAGFWHCTVYHGVGITLSLGYLSGRFSEFSSTLYNFLINRAAQAIPFSSFEGVGLSHSEHRALLSTNVRHYKAKEKRRKPK
jgi:hypothetical protein